MTDWLNKYSIKTTPHRYYIGGQVTKFQEPAGSIENWYSDIYKDNSSLSGWDPTLGKQNAGATIYGDKSSSLHGNAGDLNFAWKSNQAYTSNSGLVARDIQYWTDQWVKQNPNATPEQMVAAYNQIAALIRAYQTKGHTYNETGATAHNDNFANMFHYRSFKENEDDDKSNDLSFIGFQDDLKDKYGSSTYLRRMDRYEKEYDDLTDELKAARTHTITLGGKQVKVYKKANGDIALLPIEDPCPNGDCGDGGGEEEGGGGGGERTSSIYTPKLELKVLPFKSSWSDPIKIFAEDYIDKRNNILLHDLTSKMTSTPETSPRLFTRTTNNYGLRLALEQEKNDIYSRAETTGLYSDEDSMTRLRDLANKAVEQYNDKQIALKENEYNTTSKATEATAQYNIQLDAKDANASQKTADSLYNNILVSRAKKATGDATTDAQIVEDLYSSYLKKLGIDRTNQLKQVAALEALDHYFKLDERYKQWKASMEDPLRSAAGENFFNRLYESLLNESASFPEGLDPEDLNGIESLADVYNIQDETTRKALIAKLTNLFMRDKTALSEYQLEFEKKYNLFQDEYSRLDKIFAAMQKAGHRALIDNLIDLVGNRMDYSNPYFLHPATSRPSNYNLETAYYHKNGGIVKCQNGKKISNLEKYIGMFMKEQQSQRVADLKSAEMGYKNMQKQLDRLNQQQMLILKQLFK